MQRHTCWCRRTEFGVQFVLTCSGTTLTRSSENFSQNFNCWCPPENRQKSQRWTVHEPLIGSIGWMFSCRDQCLDEAVRPVQGRWKAGKATALLKISTWKPWKTWHGRHGTRMKSTHDMLNIGRPETSLRPKCVSWHLDSQLCRHLRSAYLCIVRLKDSFATLGLWPGCKRCQRRSKCRSRWIWYNLD